jgi:Na+/proline symporter
VNDTSRKVLRGGLLGAAIGGGVAAFLAGVLGGMLGLAAADTDILFGHNSGVVYASIFAVSAFFPGALIGALLGAIRSGSAPSADSGNSTESEMERLRKRLEELENKARNEAIQRKKGP